MNAGAPLDEVLHEVAPPAELLGKPYLRPVYDEPEFIVRNIWRLYGGWYDGNPASSSPRPRRSWPPSSPRWPAAPSALAARARELADAGDLRLAAHLADWAGGEVRAGNLGRLAAEAQSTMARRDLRRGRARVRPLTRARNSTRRSCCRSCMRTTRSVLLATFVLVLGIVPFAIAARRRPDDRGRAPAFTDITRVLGNSPALRHPAIEGLPPGRRRRGSLRLPQRIRLRVLLLSKNTGSGGAFHFKAKRSLLGGEIDVEVPTQQAARSEAVHDERHRRGHGPERRRGRRHERSRHRRPRRAAPPAGAPAYGSRGWPPTARPTRAAAQAVTDANISRTAAGVYASTAYVEAEEREREPRRRAGRGGGRHDHERTRRRLQATDERRLVVRALDSAGAPANKPLRLDHRNLGLEKGDVRLIARATRVTP